MPQIHPVSASPMELEGSDVTTLPEIHNNAEQAALLPSIATLTKKLDEIEAHLYDNTSLTAGKLADKSALLAQLVAQGATNLWEQFQGSVITAMRTANELTETHIPHRSWPETYLNIFIDENNLELQQYEKGNLDTQASEVATEDENHLDFRRKVKRNELGYAVESVRTDSLLKLLQPAAANPDSETVSFQTLINTLVASPENEPIPSRAKNNRVSQARGALDAGLEQGQTVEMKNNLLNLALDIATTAIESLPEEPNTEKAAAYLIAATSVHDLATQPGSFLPQLTEAEARDFRVRALEMASHWVIEAAAMYRKIFNDPIGTVTPESFADIARKIASIKENEKSINHALWFEGIYGHDYQEAASALDHKVRHIGQRAIILALKKPTNKQLAAQPADEIQVAV